MGTRSKGARKTAGLTVVAVALDGRADVRGVRRGNALRHGKMAQFASTVHLGSSPRLLLRCSRATSI